jgi:hypothetical protein
VIVIGPVIVAVHVNVNATVAEVPPPGCAEHDELA